MRIWRRTIGVLACLLSLVVLTACSKAVVCARHYDAKTKTYTIEYGDDVDTGQKDWQRVKVSKAEYEACTIGKPWPGCKKDAAVNEPRRDPSREEQDKNSKTVCVASISDPKATITNSWSIGRMDVKTESPVKQGSFERCKRAQTGQTAFLKAEHHSEPSTLLCKIWTVGTGGKTILLDYMITQALGDCKVMARVP